MKRRKHFQELKVWQRSHALVLDVYRLSSGFPSAERFGLVSQLRRAAVSVPTNIAEGAKRQRRQDYARFLNISEECLAETGYLLLLSRDLGYSRPAATENLLAEVGQISRMIHALRSRVEERSDP